MNRQDYYLFTYAIEQATYSSYKQKLGAVTVHRGSIIGYGHNKVHGDGNAATGSIHAEIDALLDVHGNDKKFLRGATVYVARVNKKGDLRLAKPCHRCEVIMRKAGIKYCWYSTRDGWIKWKL